MTQIQDDIRKWLRIVAATTVLCILGVASLAVYVLVSVNRTNESLCKFRGDLEQRVDQTQHFLDTHPGPEPFPHISRASLQQSLMNQRRTVKSLDNLNC